MTCKYNDEYAHLVDSPYGAGIDAQQRPAATDQSAANKNANTSDQPSTSRALLRVDGASAPASEAEAARKAREVRAPHSLMFDCIRRVCCNAAMHVLFIRYGSCFAVS